MADKKLNHPDSFNIEDPMVYPGLAGGVFEKTVTFLERLERIPYVLFFILLGLIAYLFRAGTSVFIMMAFFVGDWLVMLDLPKAGISFGPPKPQTLLLAVLRAPFALLPSPWWWLLQLIGSVLVVYAFRLEPATIKLRHQKLEWKNVPGSRVLRIFHFGDLHVERTTERDQQVIRWIHEYEPDLILYSGDVFSYSNVRDPVAYEQARELMTQINAPLGAYAVLGSPPVDVPEVLIPFYDQLPIRLLLNEDVLLTHESKVLRLVGLSCSHNPKKDGAHLKQLSRGSDADLNILLYHSPDLASVAARSGIDIQFSGHTHGGQVRIPIIGAIFTSSLYGKQFESGRYDVEGMTLYVTRGIGLEGRGAPRVRFLCPPECTLWDIYL